MFFQLLNEESISITLITLYAQRYYELLRKGIDDRNQVQFDRKL